MHQWLALASGLVVLVIATSGAFLAFAPDIMDVYLRRHARVSVPANTTPLPSSLLVERATRALERSQGPLPATAARWLTRHGDADRSVVLTVAPDETAWFEVYVDPYRGDVLLVRDMGRDPLGLLLRLHQSLLLPPAIGRPIVGAAVLVFVGSLLTGLVLWLPRRLRDWRRRGALRQRLTIRWHARAPRVAYDLHRTLGGWALLVALVLALSGLVWSFAWVDATVYWLATGGASRPVRGPWRSEPGPPGVPALDRALALVSREAPGAARYEVVLPSDPSSALSICAARDAATSHHTDCWWFDRSTARVLGTEPWHGRNVGERLSAMNYDIHVGRIAGLPGRIAALLASLIAASLPVTGALIWWRRGRMR